MSRPQSAQSAEQAVSSETGPVTRSEGVAAVVAAAGFSSRMGRFKPLLPWRGGTVIESVVAGLVAGGASAGTSRDWPSRC